MKKISNNLILLRKKIGVTKKNLAKTLNCSEETIEKWEDGTTEVPIEKLIPISKALRCSVEDVISQKSIMDEKQRQAYINKAAKEITLLNYRELQNSIAEVVYKYPDDEQYKIVVSATLFFGLFNIESENLTEAKDYCLKLLNEVISNGSCEAQKAAAFTKATILLMIDDPDESEIVLDNHQWNLSDPSDLYVQIYQKQGKNDEVKALVEKMLQENLYRVSILLINLCDCLNESDERIKLLKKLYLLEEEFELSDKTAPLKLCYEWLLCGNETLAKEYLNDYINKRAEITVNQHNQFKLREDMTLLDIRINDLKKLESDLKLKSILDLNYINQKICYLYNLKEELFTIN